MQLTINFADADMCHKGRNYRTWWPGNAGGTDQRAKMCCDKIFFSARSSGLFCNILLFVNTTPILSARCIFSIEFSTRSRQGTGPYWVLGSICCFPGVGQNFKFPTVPCVIRYFIFIASSNSKSDIVDKHVESWTTESHRRLPVVSRAVVGKQVAMPVFERFTRIEHTCW